MKEQLTGTGVIPKRQTHRGLVLHGVTSMLWFSVYTYPVILAPYLHELGASLTMTGVVIGSYGLTQTLLRIPAGILSDHLRNKKLFIVLGLFFSLVSAVGLAAFQQIWLILIFRGFAGAAVSMWVHISTLNLTYHPVEASSRAMGSINFVCNLSILAAALGGGLVAQLWGWQSAFILAVPAAGIGLLLSLAIHEDKPDPAAAVDKPVRLRDIFQIGRNRLLFWSSILALMSQLFNFATFQGFIPQFANLLGASKAEIGLLSVSSLLPVAIAGLLGGSLLARWFRLRTLIVFGFMLLGLTTCVLPLVHSLPLLFVCQFFGGMGTGFQLTLLMALCTQTIAPNRKASAMGFFQAVYGVGMVVGPILIGGLADVFNLETGFVVIGLLSMLTAVLTYFVLDPEKTIQKSF